MYPSRYLGVFPPSLPLSLSLSLPPSLSLSLPLSHSLSLSLPLSPSLSLSLILSPSLSPLQVFRPDGSNGFDVFTEADAREEQSRNRGKKVSPRMRWGRAGGEEERGRKSFNTHVHVQQQASH